jgi:hypothetical protein
LIIKYSRQNCDVGVIIYCLMQRWGRDTGGCGVENYYSISLSKDGVCLGSIWLFCLYSANVMVNPLSSCSEVHHGSFELTSNCRGYGFCEVTIRSDLGCL